VRRLAYAVLLLAACNSSTSSLDLSTPPDLTAVCPRTQPCTPSDAGICGLSCEGFRGLVCSYQPSGVRCICVNDDAPAYWSCKTQ
jgi:hypothetical protein